MPNEYNVDDILAEVLGERATKKQSAATSFNVTIEEEKPKAVVAEKPKVVESEKTTVDEFVAPRPLIPDETEVDEFATRPMKPEEVSNEVKKFVIDELKNSDKNAPLKFPIDIEDDEEDEEDIEEDDVIEDFENYSQKQTVWGDIRNLKSSLIMRTVVTAVCSVVLLVLSLLGLFNLDILSFINPNNDPVMFSAVSLVIVALAVSICYPTVLNGIASIFRLRANSDTLPSILPIFCALQLVVLMIATPESMDGVAVFAPLATLALFFNSIGKLMMVSRISSGFSVVSDERVEKFSCEVIEDSKLTYELTKELDVSAPLVCISRPANFLSDFLKNSYSEDVSDSWARMIAPIVAIGSVVVGVVNFIFNRDLFLAVSSSAAAMALATPLTSTICCNLPLMRASKKACKNGGVISGMSALDSVGEANCIYFDCADLFTKKTIFLHHFETFGDFKIDDCIVDAASITKSANIPLSNVFMNIIQDDERLLVGVDSLVYEDEMGLSAWVGSKRVLLGNRELLRTHGIEVPSREFESRYKRDGREIVYLANSGELAAFFVVSYNADPEIAKTLKRLYKSKISILVKNCDCNITTRKLMYVFDISDDYIEIVPRALNQQCETHCAQVMTAPAKAAHTGSIYSFVSTVLASIAAKSAVSFATTLQIGSIILGFALVSFFAFVSGLSQINIVTALVYQLFWLVAIALFPNLRKY